MSNVIVDTFWDACHKDVRSSISQLSNGDRVTVYSVHGELNGIVSSDGITKECGVRVSYNSGAKTEHVFVPLLDIYEVVVND